MNLAQAMLFKKKEAWRVRCAVVQTLFQVGCAGAGLASKEGIETYIIAWLKIF